VTAASKGTVIITDGGTTVTYEPDPNGFGADSFTYTISDGHGGSDTATVHVMVSKLKRERDAPTKSPASHRGD
jgi:hypothetical protein